MPAYGVTQEFLSRAAEGDAYTDKHLLKEDASLNAALASNRAADIREIDVAPNQGKQLYLLAKLNKAKRILEVGTLGGYSAIWLAKAVGHDGKLITLEIEPKHASVARENIAKAGYEDVVDVKLGPALETLEALKKEETEVFDMVFIDADKQNNLGYFKAALAMSKVGTLIIVDNVARGGRLSDLDNQSPDIVGTRQLIEYVGKEERVEATAIQTVGGKGWDGYMMALVVA